MSKVQLKKSTSNNRLVYEISKVHKSFTIGKQEIEIIKGVSFDVNRGDFIIVFGPSGCGKSTILNMLLGLEPPTSGKVSFLASDLYAAGHDDRAQLRKQKIGMVYQQSNWVKALPVIENVAFPLTLQGVLYEERMEKALTLLKRVEMEFAADQVPTELSAGQQQRVSLARALISDPVVLIADEPTGNLDSVAGEDIMNLFAEFNHKGRTVIMVTHDLEYLKFASKSIQMSDGAIVATHHANDPALKKLSISKRGAVPLQKSSTKGIS